MFETQDELDDDRERHTDFIGPQGIQTKYQKNFVPEYFKRKDLLNVKFRGKYIKRNSEMGRLVLEEVRHIN